MQIKICGIKDIDGGEASVISGANYLDLILLKVQKEHCLIILWILSII